MADTPNIPSPRRPADTPSLPPIQPPSSIGSRIYNNPNLDPTFRRGQNLAIQTARKRYQALQKEYKQNLKGNTQLQKPDAFKLMSEEYFRFMNDFAEKNPEKASRYAYAKGYENPALQRVLTIRSTSPNSKDLTDQMVRYFQSSIDTSRKFIKPSRDAIKTKETIESFLPKVTGNRFMLWATQSPTANIDYVSQIINSEIVKPTVLKLKSTRPGKFVEKKIAPFAKRHLAPSSQLNPASSFVVKKAKTYLNALNNAYLRKHLDNPFVQRLSKALGLNKDMPTPKNLFGSNKFTKTGLQRAQKAGSYIASKSKPLTATTTRAANKLGLNQNPIAPNRPASRILGGGKNALRIAGRPLGRPGGALWNRTTKSPFQLNRFSRRGSEIAGNAGKKAGKKIAGRLAGTAAKTAARALFMNPPVAIGTIIVVVFLIFFIAIIMSIFGGGGTIDYIGGIGFESPGENGGNDPDLPDGNRFQTIPGFSITLSAPSSVPNCENTTDVGCEITYTISFTHDPSIAPPLESITIYNEIPQTATFTEAGNSYQQSGNIISWPLDRAENQGQLAITLRPEKNDSIVKNRAYAEAFTTAGNLQALLPETISSSPKTDAQQQEVANTIENLPDLVSAYQLAERETGVPWQILAGIHFREGSLNPNVSLVSGRPIGANEPDIVRGGGCSAEYIQGEPVALPGGGCGFRTFADSAIYAANHFKAKNGGSTPASFQELAKSLSYYNGGGNSNCGKTPYTNCPAQFTGDDDTYVMNFFDLPHEEMYIVYCADFTLCNPPVLDGRLGVASVIMGLNRFFNQQ